ncbi:MAG: DUF5723 family protein [Bacteroidia bacterium]
MKKLFLIPAIVIFTLQAAAQTSTLFEKNYPGSKSCIGFDALYLINSTGITNEFTNKYLQGEFLDTETKDKSLNKMKDKNLLGNEFNGSLYYRYKSKKSTDSSSVVSHFFSLKERQHFNTKFTKDLFQLYFYGNEPFAGKTADISNFNYRSVQYLQLQYGMISEINNDGEIFGCMVAVSALNGQDLLEIKTNEGSFYTEENGEYVDMNLFLEAKQSDTSNTSFWSSSGIGASADFEVHYGEENKYNIRFSASDIGFIAWNKKSTTFEVDTNYHFEGVVVENLFDSLFLDVKSEQDFKDGFKENKQAKSFTTMLPFRLNLSYEFTIIPDKLTEAIGVQYIFNSDYTPLVFASCDYLFNRKTQAGIYLQYGGYGGFHAGIHFDKDFGKGFILSLGSAYLDGYIAPSSSAGQGAYAGIKKIF